MEKITNKYEIVKFSLNNKFEENFFCRKTAQFSLGSDVTQRFFLVDFDLAVDFSDK